MAQKGGSLYTYNQIREWSVDQVINFLRQNDLGDCEMAFRNRQVNGETLLNLTEGKLLLWKKDLQTKKVKHVYEVVCNLKENCIGPMIAHNNVSEPIKAGPAREDTPRRPGLSHQRLQERSTPPPASPVFRVQNELRRKAAPPPNSISNGSPVPPRPGPKSLSSASRQRHDHVNNSQFADDTTRVNKPTQLATSPRLPKKPGQNSCKAPLQSHDQSPNNESRNFGKNELIVQAPKKVAPNVQREGSIEPPIPRWAASNHPAVSTTTSLAEKLALQLDLWKTANKQNPETEQTELDDGDDGDAWSDDWEDPNEYSNVEEINSELSTVAEPEPPPALMPRTFPNAAFSDPGKPYRDRPTFNSPADSDTRRSGIASSLISNNDDDYIEQDIYESLNEEDIRRAVEAVTTSLPPPPTTITSSLPPELSPSRPRPQLPFNSRPPDRPLPKYPFPPLSNSHPPELPAPRSQFPPPSNSHPPELPAPRSQFPPPSNSHPPDLPPPRSQFPPPSNSHPPDLPPPRSQFLPPSNSHTPNLPPHRSQFPALNSHPSAPRPTRSHKLPAMNAHSPELPPTSSFHHSYLPNVPKPMHLNNRTSSPLPLNAEEPSEYEAIHEQVGGMPEASIPMHPSDDYYIQPGPASFQGGGVVHSNPAEELPTRNAPAVPPPKAIVLQGSHWSNLRKQSVKKNSPDSVGNPSSQLAKSSLFEHRHEREESPDLGPNRPQPPARNRMPPPSWRETTTTPPFVPPGRSRRSPSPQPFILENAPWFHDLDREGAVEALRALGRDGSFLVRPSSLTDNPLTLTLLFAGQIYNISIRKREDGQYALGKQKDNERNFATILALIENYREEALVLYSSNVRAGSTILTRTPQRPPRTGF